MDFITKIKLWLTTTGLTNLGYLVLFIGAVMFKMTFVAGVFLGIFVYINFNVIQKLIRNAINKIDK